MRKNRWGRDEKTEMRGKEEGYGESKWKGTGKRERHERERQGSLMSEWDAIEKKSEKAKGNKKREAKESE